VLVLVCIAVGIVPGYTFVAPLLAMAADATLQGSLPDYKLKLWHGFTPALGMSIIALSGGVLIYLMRKPLFRLHGLLLGRIDARAMFQAGERWLLALATWLNRLLHRPSLQRMVAVTLAAAAAVLIAGLWGSVLRGPEPLTPLDPVSVTAVLCLAAGAVGTVILHRRRLTALILLSVVGLIVSLAFVKLSAPDLALTQLLVEVVTIVLLLLALHFLPPITPKESSWWRRGRDLGLAAVAGLVTSALTWGVLTRPYETIAGWFVDNSVPGGGGTNVVNVILVDFRGFDTLGEITVLAIAAVGIYMLLGGLQLGAPRADSTGRPWSWDRHPLILATFSRLLLPLALLVAVFAFLRGHNLPGGGFIAGLIVAVALILQYLANGIAWTRQRITGELQPLVGLGLLIATATGLASWYFGYPFLTSTHDHFHLPVIGDVELASAMAFDLGVLLVVVGITMIILVRIGELSAVTRQPSKPSDPAEEPR